MERGSFKVSKGSYGCVKGVNQLKGNLIRLEAPGTRKNELNE